MSDILARIVAAKKERLAVSQRQAPLVEMKHRAADTAPAPDFYASLKKDGARIVAEIKRASPSRGAIAPALDAAATASAYAAGGAAAISVLTEEDFFQGGLPDLSAAAKAAPGMPLLRKDFIFAPYQIYEAKAFGAAAVLLIVRILETNQLADLFYLATELGLAPLVEIHHADELAKIAPLPACVVGINNRDLQTFDVDLNNARELAGKLAADKIPLAASGIHEAAAIRAYCEIGIKAFLIGESVAQAPEPAAKLRELLAGAL